MRFLIKLFLCLTLLVAIWIVGHLIYWGATYIDETITTGEGYGFRIRDTKEDVYEKATQLYMYGKVYMLSFDKQGIEQGFFGPHKELKFTPAEYQSVKDRDEWKFYFDEGYSDLICFKFKDGCLIEIYRHRQYFELP